jgi:hypothetical protein
MTKRKESHSDSKKAVVVMREEEAECVAFVSSMFAHLAKVSNIELANATCPCQLSNVQSKLAAVDLLYRTEKLIN